MDAARWRHKAAPYRSGPSLCTVGIDVAFVRRWRCVVRRIVTLLVLYLGIATVVSADPIRVTSGNIFVVADSNGLGFSGGFHLSGQAFEAGGGGIGVPTVTTFKLVPSDVSGTFGISPTDAGGFLILGDQTLRGVLSATFQFAADPHFVVLENEPLGLTTFETTFTATGFLQLFDDLSGTQPSFTQAVNGKGDLAVTAENLGNGTFVTRSMGLGFTPDSSPAPTPEPGSLLLVGTGLLAAWQSRRLRPARRPRATHSA